MIKEIRCPVCQKKLAECKGIVIIKCPRCKNLIKHDTEQNKIEIKNTN